MWSDEALPEECPHCGGTMERVETDDTIVEYICWNCQPINYWDIERFAYRLDYDLLDDALEDYTDGFISSGIGEDWQNE